MAETTYISHISKCHSKLTMCRISAKHNMFFFLHFQADVNSDNVDDEDEDDTNNSPKETDRLYPTAPLESDDTASVHSTSV